MRISSIQASHALLVLFALLLLLSGCAPRSISIPSPATRPVSPPSPQARPGDALPPEARPEPITVSPAVRPLLSSAQKALGRNDPRGAEIALERAIAIEPGNPLLWHTLAQARYRQADYAQTLQLCLRSNALLGTAASLRRDNFRLMAKAYRQLGQEEQARQASLQAGDR